MMRGWMKGCLWSARLVGSLSVFREMKELLVNFKNGVLLHVYIVIDVIN